MDALFWSSGAQTHVDFNIMYLKAASYLKYNVVSVSTKRHLLELQQKVELLPALPPDLFNTVEDFKDGIWSKQGTVNPYFSPLDRIFTRRGASIIKRRLVRTLWPARSPWFHAANR